jgi:broad specificity phosphatase PhoE
VAIGVRVWCLRHAESVNVASGACGALPAAPLTAAGRAQAAAAVPALAIATGIGVDLIALPALGEVDIGSAEGATDPATRAQTARVLHAWVVHGELAARVADGETGHQVLTRITTALNTIAGDNPGRTVVLVGHTASLTTGLAAACRISPNVWDRPLPPAMPFPIRRQSHAWHCPRWP